MKIHWHKITPYRTEIGFCFGSELTEINKYISKYAGEGIDAEDSSCCITLTAENGHKKYVVFVEEAGDYDSLIHELFHATIRILTDRCAFKEIKDDEQGAYLCGYLMRLAMKDFK